MGEGPETVDKPPAGSSDSPIDERVADEGREGEPEPVASETPQKAPTNDEKLQALFSEGGALGDLLPEQSALIENYLKEPGKIDELSKLSREEQARVVATLDEEGLLPEGVDAEALQRELDVDAAKKSLLEAGLEESQFEKLDEDAKAALAELQLALEGKDALTAEEKEALAENLKIVEEELNIENPETTLRKLIIGNEREGLNGVLDARRDARLESIGENLPLAKPIRSALTGNGDNVGEFNRALGALNSPEGLSSQARDEAARLVSERLLSSQLTPSSLASELSEDGSNRLGRSFFNTATHRIAEGDGSESENQESFGKLVDEFGAAKVQRYLEGLEEPGKPDSEQVTLIKEQQQKLREIATTLQEEANEGRDSKPPLSFSLTEQVDIGRGRQKLDSEQAEARLEGAETLARSLGVRELESLSQGEGPLAGKAKTEIASALDTVAIENVTKKFSSSTSQSGLEGFQTVLNRGQDKPSAGTLNDGQLSSTSEILNSLVTLKDDESLTESQMKRVQTALEEGTIARLDETSQTRARELLTQIREKHVGEEGLEGRVKAAAELMQILENKGGLKATDGSPLEIATRFEAVSGGEIRRSLYLAREATQATAPGVVRKYRDANPNEEEGLAFAGRFSEIKKEFDGRSAVYLEDGSSYSSSLLRDAYLQQALKEEDIETAGDIINGILSSTTRRRRDFSEIEDSPVKSILRDVNNGRLDQIQVQTKPDDLVARVASYATDRSGLGTDTPTGGLAKEIARIDQFQSAYQEAKKVFANSSNSAEQREAALKALRDQGYSNITGWVIKQGDVAGLRVASGLAYSNGEELAFGIRRDRLQADSRFLGQTVSQNIQRFIPSGQNPNQFNPSTLYVSVPNDDASLQAFLLSARNSQNLVFGDFGQPAFFGDGQIDVDQRIPIVTQFVPSSQGTGQLQPLTTEDLKKRALKDETSGSSTLRKPTLTAVTSGAYFRQPSSVVQSPISPLLERSRGKYQPGEVSSGLLDFFRL